MKKTEFINECKTRGLVLSDQQMEQFDAYASFLAEYNEKINLTAITAYEEVLEKHFFDSLLFTFKKELSGTLVDVGTGAGFPGVVCKIAYPELEVLLIEPLKKRCVFLEALIEKLELKGIEVVNARGEDYVKDHREKYDFVTARAVSNLNGLIEVCGALVKKEGYFVALRGSSGIEEIENAKRAIKTMGFEIEEPYVEELNEGKRVISFFKKIQATPKTYPRKYSIIKQKPL